MMRERAEAVGAELMMVSRSGHGTEVTLRWPATQEKEAT
jgi:nitrate/nitrite-specific signal transduction histidine kinase